MLHNELDGNGKINEVHNQVTSEDICNSAGRTVWLLERIRCPHPAP